MLALGPPGAGKDIPTLIQNYRTRSFGKDSSKWGQSLSLSLCDIISITERSFRELHNLY